MRFFFLQQNKYPFIDIMKENRSIMYWFELWIFKNLSHNRCIENEFPMLNSAFYVFFLFSFFNLFALSRLFMFDFNLCTMHMTKRHYIDEKFNATTTTWTNPWSAICCWKFIIDNGEFEGNIFSRKDEKREKMCVNVDFRRFRICVSM